MPATGSSLSPIHAALLSRVIRQVSRTHRLRREDVDDFAQTVHLKLLERRDDIFECFEGRSSLATYLTVVVTRLLLDWRNATRGKWRPSVAAVRLGPDAVALERFMYRDGLTRGEAVATLASRQGRYDAQSDRRLHALADRLPTRVRAIVVSEHHPDRLGHVDFCDPVAEADDRRARREQRQALRRACASLPSEDRHLLGLRYSRALTVQAIGRHLRTDPKPLYRRLERSLDTLRRQMESSGLGVPGGDAPARRESGETAGA